MAASEGERQFSVKGRSEGFDVLETPAKDSNVLHKVPQSSELIGWLGTNERWPQLYSILIYKIDDREIATKTAGFIEKKLVSVTQLPDEDDAAESQPDGDGMEPPER